MRKVTAVLCLFVLIFLFSSCGFSPSGPVYCRSPLTEDSVRPVVKLSDGELDFRMQPVYPMLKGVPVTNVDVPPGHSVLNALVSWSIPEGAEPVTYTYEDITRYIQCDILQVLENAEIPARCIPAAGDFVTEGYRLTKDVHMELGDHIGDLPFDLRAGSIWGSDIYIISYAPDEEFRWMLREFGLAINHEGEFTGLYFDPEVWSEEANSRVGDIPVYTNYNRNSAPALGGWESDEFFACFNVAGYSCALYANDFTQQEFVDVLLAIINHYGAYPSQE